MPQSTEIERHRAAMYRTEISRPVRLAMEAEIFTKDTTFFDYGCGIGGDVDRLTQLGYQATGWDPYYNPKGKHVAADVVNLGYVLNVIEKLRERSTVLRKAWKLTRKVLIVSAQVLINDRSNNQLAYGDGIVTRRNTFQKYYEQKELKKYIDETLQVDAVPVALGIYFVFRDETQKENFRANLFFYRAVTPRVRIPVKKFEDCKEQLEPLMTFITNRGRLPVKGEWENEAQIKQEFGSYRRAYDVILQATDEAEWDAIAYRRSLDILVYLALAELEDRRSSRKLPLEMRHDIKAFFGTYQEACEVADRMLFSLGNPGIIENACKKSKVGKLTRSALYIHVSALQELEALLRIYEGCASRTIGRVDGATLIKFNLDKPHISYLFYPDFDENPHPSLKTSININFKTLDITYRDYSEVENPPILHRKETFLIPTYPNYEIFAQLTEQEEQLGLLKNKSEIGTRQGWEKCLLEHGLEIRGHQVYQREQAEKN